MNSCERFQQTMCYGRPDRVPYFEEGIRNDVLRVWRAQGMPADRTLSQMFPTDRRHEIAPELEPRPSLESWPNSISELAELRQKLDPDDPGRLPGDWIEGMRAANACGDVVMFRVHRGFFQSLGVFDWDRFEELMYLLTDDPAFVQEAMFIVGDFSVRLAERVLKEVRVDAAIFGEPIGGNSGPLISPQMYEELVLPSYEPLLDVLRQQGVETIIFRTYANARVLVPSVLKWGFNCLWACEVNLEAMDYRDLRREFGRELRLIGGIDVDVLRHDKETIRREVEEKVPPLLADGGYVPLADGRIRAEVPFENYVYYRGLLEEVIHS